MSTDEQTAANVLLRAQAMERPGTYLRLLFPGGLEEVFTYAQVMERAMHWRSLFAQRGLGTGDRVVIVLKHSLDLYGAFLGALLGGHVPAMFAFPTPKFSEQAYFATVGQLLDNARPRLVAAFPELLVKLQPWLKSAAAPVEGVVPRDAEACAPLSGPPAAVAADATAFLQYSSGTTGLRKGVAISHRALLWQVKEYARAIDLRADDVVVTWLPLYHDMGLVACFLMPFLTCTPVTALSAFDWVKRPASLLRALSEHKGTLCWLPNFSYNFMARSVHEQELVGVRLDHVRGFVNCSEPVMAESHRLFLERFRSIGVRDDALAVSYAMAENTFAVTSGGFGQPVVTDWVDVRALGSDGRALPVAAGGPTARALVSCGVALPDTHVEIVDEKGEVLGERHVGEIVLRSPCMLNEYFSNEADTLRAIRDGRLFTGDVGYLAGGHVYVTGRKKDMIIVGGQNVFPQDIEAIVSEQPGVIPGRCVALGRVDETAGTEALIVIAESSASDHGERDRLTRAIAEAIAARTDVVASDVMLVPHMWLHKSSSGKIARAENLRRYLELKAQAGALSSTAQPVSSAGGAVDLSAVMAAVRRVLDQTPSNRGRSFAAHDPILSSGAIDSFGLVSLISEIERTFGVRIPDDLAGVEHLDNADRIHRMLAGLATHQARAADVPQTPADILLRAERIAPAQPGSEVWTLYYRALFRLRGIRFGTNLQVRGPLTLRLGDTPSNLSIGDQVTLMPGVDLKLRDKGRIEIGNGVQLDTSVRLVAANRAVVRLGDNVRIGMGTIVNAGTDLTVGRGSLIASSCIIDSSEHRFEGREPVSSQGFVHSPVLIGEDVWLGARVFVEMGSRIGRGAILGVASVVAGDITAFSVAMGNPARVVKMR